MYVSAGWNCHSATEGVRLGLRSRRAEGYKTCPFDEMVTNYKGLAECIRDGLDPLYDVTQLRLVRAEDSCPFFVTGGKGDLLIVHKKYSFIFNHESPGHAGLHVSQAWSGGINHYVKDNFREFRARYARRVSNLKTLFESDQAVNFLLTVPTPHFEEASSTIYKAFYERYEKELRILHIPEPCPETYRIHTELMSEFGSRARAQI